MQISNWRTSVWWQGMSGKLGHRCSAALQRDEKKGVGVSGFMLGEVVWEGAGVCGTAFTAFEK